MENVTIHAINGFGILSQYCENVTFRSLTIVPREGRTIASNADFIHASGCSGQFIVENCKMAEGHDDFINIHGTHLQIVNQEGRYLRVRFVNPNTWGFPAFNSGDTIDYIPMIMP